MDKCGLIGTDRKIILSCCCLGFPEIPLTNIHNSQSEWEQILGWIVNLGREVPAVRASASCGNGIVSSSFMALLDLSFLYARFLKPFFLSSESWSLMVVGFENNRNPVNVCVTKCRSAAER